MGIVTAMRSFLLATAITTAIAMPITLTSARAAEPEGDSSKSALELAQAGRNEEAVEFLRSHPANDPAYFYNLGTLLLKLERPGPAVAYLEKAVAVGGDDSATRTNLKIARNALSRVVGESQLDPAANAFEKVLEEVGGAEAWAALCLLALVSVAFGCRSYLVHRRLRGAPGGSSSWFAAAILGVTALAMIAVARIQANPPAVLTEPQAIRSGPGPDFLELGHAEAGVKMRPTGKASGSWRQVRYAADAIGWIEGSKFVVLDRR